MNQDDAERQPGAGRLVGHRACGHAEVSNAVPPAGYSFEWTCSACQEQQAAGQTGTALMLAVLFAYLFLVALHESMIIAITALLSVVVAMLGSSRGLRSRQTNTRSSRSERR